MTEAKAVCDPSALDCATVEAENDMLVAHARLTELMSSHDHAPAVASSPGGGSAAFLRSADALVEALRASAREANELAGLLDELRAVEHEIDVLNAPPPPVSSAVAHARAPLSETVAATAETLGTVLPRSALAVCGLIETCVASGNPRDAAECADAFRAVATLCHGAECSDLPHHAVVLSNALSHIARISAACACKAKGTDGSAELARAAELCAESADTSMAAEVARRKTSICAAVDVDGKGLSGTWEPERSRAVEGAVAAAARELRLVASVWRDLLSDSAWRRMACDLLSGLAAEVVRRVEEIGDISEKEGQSLHRTIGSLLPLAGDVLHLDDAVASTALSSPAPLDSARASASLPALPEEWRKMALLRELLDMPLLKIGEAVEAGELREFTPKELRALVEGLFTDTKNRQAVIATIKARAVADEGRK